MEGRMHAEATTRDPRPASHVVSQLHPLTPQMRAWLTTPGRAQMRTADVCTDFVKVFRLTPEHAGRALAEFIREQWSALP
jgi:hypothetical protein